MACVSSSSYCLPLHLRPRKCPHFHFHFHFNFPTASSYSNNNNNKKPAAGLAICKSRAQESEGEPETDHHRPCSSFGIQFQAKRRQVLLATTFAAFSFPQIISPPFTWAENEGFKIFTDDVNKFKILIPQEWEVGAGEPSGFKSVTAFYPEEGYSSISVVITGLGPDYTKMESFGKVEAFADTLVSGLDRSWQRPPGVAAKLIDCKASKGLYFIEYTLQKPGESCKHLFSALGMASNGWYNRLYTVTGQYLEEESAKYSSNIEKAVKSFSFI